MTATLEPAPSFAPAPARRRWGRIVAIVAGAMVASLSTLVLALVLFVNAATGDAEKVSAQLVRAIQAGDGAAAYALGGADFRGVASQAKVEEVVDFIAPLVEAGAASPDGKAIHASTDRGKVAVFTYTLDGTSGKPVYLKTQLQEVDGAWRVLSFKTSDDPLDTEVS